MTLSEAWKALFPTYRRFFAFAFRTHAPYALLITTAAVSWNWFHSGAIDGWLLIGLTVLSAIYLWIFIFKAFTLRSEIVADAEFRAAYLAMTNAERRTYFRKRGFDVDLSSLQF